MTALTLLTRESLGYGEKQVLAEVSFSLSPGERVILLGHSGAGKTTLLNAIYERMRSGNRIALVPQDYALVPQLTVFHNVYMGRLEDHGALYNLLNLVHPRASQRKLIGPILEEIGLAAQERQSVEALSGGQKQRVALGRALFRGGRALIADEPVSAVDERHAAELLEIIATHFETSVLALHDVDLALSFATRLIGLRGGRVLFDESRANLDRGRIEALYAA